MPDQHQQSGNGDGSSVRFADLLDLRARGFDDPADLEAEREYQQAADRFARANPAVRFAVGLSGATGVLLTATGEFTYLVRLSRLDFDWSAAQRIVFRIDAIAEQAREWWLLRPSKRGIKLPRRASAHPESHASPGTGGGSSRAERNAAQQAPEGMIDARPHLDRAYTLMTYVLSIVERENRQHGRSEPEDDPPSDPFLNNLASIKPELERASSMLQIAGQSRAQAQYARGMAYGAAVLAALAASVGLTFVICDVPAWYGVAFPAGGIGAIVSVLQRMTTRSLSLDQYASDRMLAVYGAVRPLVGGIFGLVLLALVEGGLAVDVNTNSALAFYSALGFFAGFSERFAQDMLAGSVGTLGLPGPPAQSPKGSSGSP